MSKRVQWIGHITAAANEFIGREREITVDTQALELRLHDGATEGGHRFLTLTALQTIFQPLGSAEFNSILADTIDEFTGNHGVEIDGVLIKDGQIDGQSIAGITAAIAAAAEDADEVGDELATHIADETNPHSVTKTQVGLSAVTNDAQLKIASNLSDLNNAGTARTSLGLGTAAVLNVGTGANNIVQLDANGAAPQVPGLFITGMVLPYLGTTAPTGWLLLSGGTIGNASSSGTLRADADTSALFTLIWNSFANAQAAVSGGRGANAAADFAANKNIAVPDLRGRVVAGKDDMGGSSANRLTTALNGDTMGATGGAETHTLTATEMPTHSHQLTTSTAAGADTAHLGVSHAGTLNANKNTETAGSGGTHNNTQPTITLSYIVKL